jgi:carboxypeptidase PM20D1
MPKLIKSTLLAVGGALVVLVAILVVRTWQYGARRQPDTAVQQAGAANEPVDSGAVARLSEAVRFRTITYADSASKISEFIKLHAFLESAYPLVHQRMTREVIDSGALLYTWRGTDTTLAPVLLMGHQDVVPVEPGTEKNWKHGAFSGDVSDGYVWGRGTLDDKISVLGLLEGAESLLKRGVQPRRTLIFSFGHNEEGGGASAEHAARLLESRGIRPWFVMDEGGALGDELVPGVPGLIAVVGVAEKGYLSLRLTARGEGGHSSMPRPESAVSILADAVSKVQRTPLPSRLNDATLAMFNTLGPLMPYPRRLVMANLWLFDPMLRSMLSKIPSGNAMVRTTTAVTMMNAGIKDNVVPSTATAVVNFRLQPGDSVAWVISRVKEIIHDDRVAVEPLFGGGRPASGVSPSDSDGFKIIAQTIREVFPGALVSPYLVLGGTDAQNFYRVSPNVYRFAPIVAKDETLSLIHGTNERVRVDNYLAAVRLYRRLIENASR